MLRERWMRNDGFADGGVYKHFAQAQEKSEVASMITEVEEPSSWVDFQKESDDLFLTEDMK